MSIINGKKYVDDYEDIYGRIDMVCPYCGGLHSVPPDASNWGCRDCGNTFNVNIKVIDKVKKWLGLSNE